MFFNTELVKKLKILCLLSNFNVRKSHQIEPTYPKSVTHLYPNAKFVTHPHPNPKLLLALTLTQNL